MHMGVVWCGTRKGGLVCQVMLTIEREMKSSFHTC